MERWWTRLPLDHARLWRIVRRGTLAAAVPASAFTLWACGPCPVEDRVYLLREPEAEVQALIAMCSRQDAPDCRPLCAHLVQGETSVFEHCELHTGRDGYQRVHVGWKPPCPGGRRPEGLALDTPGGEAVGAWLARLAALEAASVPAFSRLAAELAAHAAPAALVAAARAAVADEVRHAKLISTLARASGASPCAPAVEPWRAARPLEAVLLENAAEGCVRETYGAALALHQGLSAAAPEVRAAFSAIAVDETAHAALAWAVDAWGRQMLGARGGRRLRDGHQEAHEALRAELEVDTVGPLESLGLPAPETALRLLDVSEGTRWVA